MHLLCPFLPLCRAIRKFFDVSFSFRKAKDSVDADERWWGYVFFEDTVTHQNEHFEEVLLKISNAISVDL